MSDYKKESTAKRRGSLSKIWNRRSGRNEGFQRAEHEHCDFPHVIPQLQKEWSGEDIGEEGDEAERIVHLHKVSSTKLLTRLLFSWRPPDNIEKVFIRRRNEEIIEREKRH